MRNKRRGKPRKSIHTKCMLKIAVTVIIIVVSVKVDQKKHTNIVRTAIMITNILERFLNSF